MGWVTGRQLVNLLGALTVTAVLAGLAFGLPAWDRSLPADRPVSAGTPYRITAGVTVVPPRGAVLDVTGTRPGDDQGSVLFRIGPVRYAIDVQPFDGTLAMAATRLRQRITGTPGYQVTGGQFAVATGTGLRGLQGGYTAPGRGGRYAAYRAGPLTIEVTISGAELDLGRTLPAIEASARTIRYVGAT
jgi:hypothetical protein